MNLSLAPVHVVLFRVVRIVTHIFTVVDFHHVCTGMLATLDLCHRVAPWNVLSVSDVIVLIATAGTVIFAFDFRHLLYLSQNSNIESEVQSIGQCSVGPRKSFEWKNPGHSSLSGLI